MTATRGTRVMCDSCGYSVLAANWPNHLAGVTHQEKDRKAGDQVIAEAWATEVEDLRAEIERLKNALRAHHSEMWEICPRCDDQTGLQGDLHKHGYHPHDVLAWMQGGDRPTCIDCGKVVP